MHCQFKYELKCVTTFVPRSLFLSTLLYLFKNKIINGPFLASFSFIFVFSIQLTVNKCSIYKFLHDDWIRTADLWYRKRPLYQLRHDHCPTIFYSSIQFFLHLLLPFFLRWIFTWGGNKPATTVTNPRMPTTHTLSLSLFISNSLSLSHTFIHSHTTTPYQCDQIGLLLKSLGDIFSNKISPNIGQLFVLFKKTLFLRNN